MFDNVPKIGIGTWNMERDDKASCIAAIRRALELAASGALDDMYTYPGTTRTFPSWRYEQYVIWGLTRRILDDLLALAK